MKPDVAEVTGMPYTRVGSAQTTGNFVVPGTTARRIPKRLLIHVGYQKTGSTWLQRCIFDSGRFGFLPWSPEQSEQHADPLWSANRLNYSLEQLRDSYLARLRPDTPEGACVALSSERLSGSFLSGGYDSDWNARALRQMFPDALVLIMVREQRSMLLSAYAQYVKAGGTLPLARYLATPRTGKMPAFDLRFFEFHNLVELYRKLFGPERVLVLPHELLSSAPAVLVAELRNFCGLPGPVPPLPELVLNRAPGPLALAVMRGLNPLRRSDVVNGYSRLATRSGRYVVEGLCSLLDGPLAAAAGRRILARWRAEIETAVGGRYGPSNRALAAATGLPLAQLGYDLGPEPQTSSAATAGREKPLPAVSACL